MRKKLCCLVVMIVVFGVISSGCGKLSYKTNEPKIEDIYSGSQGVVIEFSKEGMPDKISEGTTFGAGIWLKNKGAHDVKKGFLLLGYEKEFLNLYSWKDGNHEDRVSFSIRGKSLSIPEGEEDYRFANMESRDIGIQREQADTTIYATACYDYITRAIAQVCIDTDPYNIKETEKVCKAADVRLNNQGAPLAVKNIEYQLSISKNDNALNPQFTIHIGNLDDGTIIASGKSDMACSAQPLSKDDVNVIKVRASLSESDLICSPNPIKLTEQSDYTICRLENGIDENQPSYYAPLEIVLEYDYMDTISKTFTIMKQGI